MMGLVQRCEVCVINIIIIIRVVDLYIFAVLRCPERIVGVKRLIEMVSHLGIRADTAPLSSRHDIYFNLTASLTQRTS